MTEITKTPADIKEGDRVKWTGLIGGYGTIIGKSRQRFEIVPDGCPLYCMLGRDTVTIMSCYYYLETDRYSVSKDGHIIL